MTANLTLDACGAGSDTQKLYYGKSTIVTGDPFSGTGWTMWTGSPIAGNITSVSIPGLDYNVEYTFYRYCHCPINGDVGPEIKDNKISYECPINTLLVPGSNSINYTFSVPSSFNNVGTKINNITISLGDQSSSTIYAINYHVTPLSSSVSGSFTGVSSSFAYKLIVQYKDINGVILHTCGEFPITTQPACTNPTMSILNVTGNSFDVDFHSSIDYPGDTYNIVVNGTTVVSGLLSTSTPYTVSGLNPNTNYTVQVVKNCGYGGQTTVTANTTTLNATIVGTITTSCNDSGCSVQGQTGMTINFNQATPIPLALYFGFIWHYTGPNTYRAAGYDIFTIPGGVSPDTGFYSSPNLPFVVNVPQGVTTFNVPNTPGMFQTIPQSGHPWVCHECLFPTTDIYVKVNNVGYVGNFSLTNAGKSIHNV